MPTDNIVDEVRDLRRDSRNPDLEAAARHGLTGEPFVTLESARFGHFGFDLVSVGELLERRKNLDSTRSAGSHTATRMRNFDTFAEKRFENGRGILHGSVLELVAARNTKRWLNPKRLFHDSYFNRSKYSLKSGCSGPH